MKILLLTDYSELSGYVRNITDKLAEKTNSEVLVLNIVNIPSDVSILNETTIDDKGASDGKKYIQERSESLEKIKEFTSSMKAEHQEFVYFGGLLDTIEEFIKTHKIDMLAMGAKYSRGFMNFVNNTLVETVIKSIEIPVLSLKCNRDQTQFENILISCNFSEDVQYDFKIVKALQKAFNSKIHLVYSNYKKKNESELLAQMERFSAKYELNAFALKVANTSHEEEGIIQYAEQYQNSSAENIEFLVVEKRKYTFCEKLFSRNRAAKFVNHVQKPILTILSN